MARAPFTYPFCYTPEPDIVAASRRLIACLDAASESDSSSAAKLPDGSSEQIAVDAASGPDRNSDYPAIPLEGVQGVKTPSGRTLAGESAPGHALFLSEIKY